LKATAPARASLGSKEKPQAWLGSTELYTAIYSYIYIYTIKVREIFADKEALLRSSDFMGAVQVWSKVGKVANMHVERLLKRMKDYAKTMKPGAPDIARVCGAGMIGEWQRIHRDGGGDDFRTLSRGQLRESGAPINASLSVASQKHMTRPQMLYANSRWSQCTDKSSDGRARFLRKSFAEYDSLSETERVTFEVQAASEQRGGEGEAIDGRAQFDDSILWALACKDAPVDVSLADAHIRAALGVETYGFKRWCDKFSSHITTGLFCKDEGQLWVNHSRQTKHVFNCFLNHVNHVGYLGATADGKLIH
jgi:hypothetical protein